MSSEIKFSPSSPGLRKQSGDKSDKFKNLRQVAESYTENGSLLNSFRCKTTTTIYKQFAIDNFTSFKLHDKKIVTCVTTVWRAANFCKTRRRHKTNTLFLHCHFPCSVSLLEPLRKIKKVRVIWRFELSRAKFWRKCCEEKKAFTSSCKVGGRFV